MEFSILWLALTVQKSGIQEPMKNNNGGISDLALIVQKWAKTFTSNVLIILIKTTVIFIVIVIVYGYLIIIVRIVIGNSGNHTHLKRLDNPD